jgi:hypothetical protein
MGALKHKDFHEMKQKGRSGEKKQMSAYDF